MITLRPHQVAAIEDEKRLRLNPLNQAILIVLPTGAGKSLTLADYAKWCYHNNKICIVFAHRDRLILQLSEALCKTGIPHTFICSTKARRDITNNNVEKFGNSFWDEYSPIIVSSNPTFSARIKGNKIPESFLQSVHMWIQDEAHHVTEESQLWGACVKALPNAIGLGFTATPIRGDKKGLGRHADGFFDAMSVTTNMWDLIQAGMLSPYKIFAPDPKVDLSGVRVTASGDYNNKEVAKRTNKREITGDAIDHYLRIARGERAITFCVNIEHARAVADQFNKAGVPSAAISSKDSDEYIQQTMHDFDNGIILNLVNVDLLGEGYDSPSITVGIMLRPTASYSLYKQQFGRILRTSEGKTHGILLDHVGNTEHMMVEYNLQYPHDDPEWTLDRMSKRKKSAGEALPKTHKCPECARFWMEQQYGDTCPDCGHSMTDKEKESEHRKVQEREGHLTELSFDVMDALIAERAKVDLPMEDFVKLCQGMPDKARFPALNNHAKRLSAQVVLRDAIQNWCARMGRENHWSVDTVQREFQIIFGVNILKAQTFGERQANELLAKVKSHG